MSALQLLCISKYKTRFASKNMSREVGGGAPPLPWTTPESHFADMASVCATSRTARVTSHPARAASRARAKNRRELPHCAPNVDEASPLAYVRRADSPEATEQLARLGFVRVNASSGVWAAAADADGDVVSHCRIVFGDDAAAVTVDGTRLQDVLAAQAGGHRIVGTMSRTMSSPSPAPSPAIDTRSLDSNETRATASSYTPSSDARSLPG